MTEDEQRSKIIEVAKEYIGTKYHPNARVKGHGVDCLTLISGAFEDAGLIDRADIPHYSPQFMLHKSEEKYVEGLLRYTREIFTPPQSGDISMWKFGRCFSHGAIVTQWPLIIHAYVGRTVQEEDVSKAGWLCNMKDGSPRPNRFFSYWGR